MKTICITGAFWFIGKNAAKLYAAKGWHVTGIGHGSWDRSEWQQWGLADCHLADITLDSMLTYAGRPDVILHCAGSGSVGFSMDHPFQDYQRTVSTAAAVLEFIRQHPKVHVDLVLLDRIVHLVEEGLDVGLRIGQLADSSMIAATVGQLRRVFVASPELLERAGRTPQGSITGFYSVLVEGDDHNEPIADAVRGILDGHTVLSRDLAARGHYPAIDILNSVSRLASRLATPDQKEAAQRFREALAHYERSEDLINLGAYAAGSNPDLDAAIKLRPKLLDFLRQEAGEKSPPEATLQRMLELVSTCNS